MDSDSQPFVRVAVWGEPFTGDKFQACATESQPECVRIPKWAQKGHKTPRLARLTRTYAAAEAL